MAYFLGIDGGGSKTSCAVGDDTSLLATVTGGPSNITRVGEARARKSLHQAVREACSAAKVDPSQVERVCIGVAGAGRKEIAADVRKIIGEVISGKIDVVGDMQIALEAAFGAGPGVIVIAGTGSIAYGRDQQGRTARAGGWGFAISDEGSAHWIGRTAVGALLRGIDERIEAGNGENVAEELPLYRELKAAWKLHALDEFVRMGNANPDFAALLPTIVASAEGGDALAERVLTQAGRELAQLAIILVSRVFPDGDATQSAIPLALAGGVFRHSGRVREVFCDEIGKVNLRVQVSAQIVEPVVGALQMARQLGQQSNANHPSKM